MTSFLLFIPLGLVLYGIWRAIRQPLFLACIPFFQVMNTSIFFDKISIFWVPGRIAKPLLILFWLILSWFLFNLINRKINTNSKQAAHKFSLIFPFDYIILFILGLWLFNFISNLVIYRFDQNILDQGLNLITMFLGYFLLRDMIIKAQVKDSSDFLNFILFVNIIALGTFIVDYSLNLGLLSPSYSETIYQSILVKRSFLPVPFFWFGIAYAFSTERWKFKEIILIIFSIVAILLSGTRSLLVVTAFLFVLALIIQFFKKNQRKYIGEKLLVLFILGAFLFVVITTLYQANFNFLIDRLNGISNSASAAQDNSLTVRIFDIQQTITMIQKSNPITGLGFMGSDASGYFLGNLRIWFADTDWAAIIWRYGLLGLVIFFSLYISSIYFSIKKYLISNDRTSSFWMMLFLWVLAIVLFSLFSWTIFTAGEFYVLALFPFVLISTGILKSKNQAFFSGA